METVREHDKLYLSEQRYDRPKEAFKFMVERAIDRYGPPLPGSRVCDIGCAAGEFAFYLQQLWPQADVVGYDLRSDLVQRATQMVPKARFLNGSVLDPNMMPKGSANLIFMAGVLSIFDDFRPSIDNILTWLKPGGLAIVFGIFNPAPLDVIIRSRMADADSSEAWETGWNVFSVASIEAYLSRHPGAPAFSFQPFSIPIDLPPNPSDPLRSWTIALGDEKRLIVNGLCLVHHFMALEISLPA